MSVTQWFQYQTIDFYDTGTQKLVPQYVKRLNVEGMLKNSSTHAVSVPINISTKLGFTCVNGPRETYFVLCISGARIYRQ